MLAICRGWNAESPRLHASHKQCNMFVATQTQQHLKRLLKSAQTCSFEALDDSVSMILTASLQARSIDCIDPVLSHSRQPSELQLWSVHKAEKFGRNVAGLQCGAMGWDAHCHSAAPTLFASSACRANHLFAYWWLALLSCTHDTKTWITSTTQQSSWRWYQ